MMMMEEDNNSDDDRVVVVVVVVEGGPQDHHHQAFLRHRVLLIGTCRFCGPLICCKGKVHEPRGLQVRYGYGFEVLLIWACPLIQGPC